MAPTDLLRRQYGYGYNNCNSYGYSYSNGGCYYSGWNAYGRWIVLAAIIIGAFLIFLIFSCITARRRRRAGQNPYRFTGWAGGNVPPGHAPAQYTGAPATQYGAPQGPPAYGQTSNAGYYGNGTGYGHQGANQGYFGGQQTGIELQQPNSSYQPMRGGDPVYAPPEGPPPGKKGDGIIR